jgi:hypothetical protein
MGLRALLGYIPIVGDILAGLDTAAKFISNDEDDVSGLIKKGAKAISSSKQQETYRVKPADNPKGTAVTSGRLSFSEGIVRSLSLACLTLTSVACTSSTILTL